MAINIGMIPLAVYQGLFSSNFPQIREYMIQSVLNVYFRMILHYCRCRQIWLTHWDRVTHICVSDLTIIGSDNGLSPGRRQAIIWTNAELLLNGPLGTTFNEILIAILTFVFKKMCLKVSSAKWRPFCLDLNVLLCHHRSVQEVLVVFIPLLFNFTEICALWE